MASTDFGRKNFPLAAYASLLSSCGVPESSYPVDYTSSSPTTTSGSAGGSSSATPTPTCTGKTYVSKEDDTCESISESQAISTDRLVEINHLDYACKSLVQGTKLCIEKTCHTYKVKANQTCQNIVKGQSFGMVQLIGWNPTIHQNCDNLGSMVGRSICISPLGGGDFSLPGSNKSSTSRGLTSSMFSSWTPATPTTMATDISTSWYWPTQDLNYTPVPMSYGPNSTWTSLMAERTQYCWLAGDQMNNWEFDDSEEMPSDCTSLYSSYCDLGPTDPVPKSPASSIPKTCTPETSTEEPEPSTTATPTGITTPTPTQSGMADKCNKFYKVQKDDGCQKIADDNKISVASLVSWNPDIGKECRNIKYDFYVCVGRESTSTSTSATTTGVTTPTPTQTGMVDGCDKFHKVEKDEGCQKIADDFSISVNQLKEWNPDVGKECTNLKYDFYACVGRSSSSGTSATTTTSVKSTTTANASGTPTPTQEGMVSGCKKFHKVLKDEYCAKIADESKISLNDFLSWNPDVGSNCGNLKYDFYVCIGK